MAVFGILSLIIWSLILVVTIKYVFIIMRADNHGEGGVFALTALICNGLDSSSRLKWVVTIIGTIGAALFFGDSMITPAISVLSAVEGLNVISPSLNNFIIPISLTLITGLFAIERMGTGKVGAIFGPIMLLWFSSLGLMGLLEVINQPAILLAFNPITGIRFLLEHSTVSLVILGSVVLAVTGGEALYADMGHFGRKPINIAWLWIVFPCLVLNYLGQGALLLRNPSALDNPFYRIAPEWGQIPLLILASCATLIASQAVISGTFSLASQAVQMGYIPRIRIKHTSSDEEGQVYLSKINILLFVGVICLILGFKTSEKLAAAYGISVTSTMLITTILLAVVMFREWKMNIVLVAFITFAFFLVDFAFWTANLIKIEHGGWYPLALGLLCFTCLITWYRGRQILRKRAIEGGIKLSSFIEGLLAHPPHRVEGTAIFLTAHVDYLPVSFLHNLKHNHVLHERVFFLKVSIWDVPYVNDDERITLEDLGSNIFVVRAVYGFKETPDMASIIHLIEHHFKMHFDMMNTSFFLSRDTIVPSPNPGMALWRERLFCWMYQNAGRQSDFFNIPANRLVELGAKVEI
jgi:KUP system potassium uptake protein